MSYKYGKYKVDLLHIGEITEYVYAESQEKAIQLIKDKLKTLDKETFMKLLNPELVRTKCSWVGNATNDENDVRVFNEGCLVPNT